MIFFRLLHKMYKKSVGFSLLWAAVLAVIAIIPFIISFNKGLSYLSTQEVKDLIGECIIENNELSCSEDYIQLGDDVLINLTENSYAIDDDKITLTRYEVKFGQNSSETYEELLYFLGFNDTMTYNDFVKFVDNITSKLFVVFTVLLTIGLVIWNIAYNFLVALVNQFYFKVFDKKRFEYNYSTYKLAMYAITPLVIINAITTMFFEITFIDYIVGYLPFFNSSITILLEGLVIYYISKLILNSEKETVTNLE